MLGEICPHAEASIKHPIFSLKLALRFGLTQSFMNFVGAQLVARKVQYKDG